MRAAEGTIERAIVFEQASGYRRVCAQRCVVAWSVLFDEVLVEVDLGLRIVGPVLFAVARFRAEQFTDEVAARFTTLGEHAGGTEVPLSELSTLERANFKTRLGQCVHRRMGVAPEVLPQLFEAMFAVVDRAAERAQEADRRAAVRYPVTAPAMFSLGEAPGVEAEVENLSSGGAFLRTDAAAPLATSVSVEMRLPAGVVKAEGKVVNVSSTGMGVQFAPAPGLARGLAENLGALAPAPLPASSPSSLASLIAPAAAPSNAVPPVRLGDYALLSMLGRGGTGEVHFARGLAGPRAGQFVAIKRLHQRLAQDSEAVKRFVSEAQTLSMLDHPAIVKIFEAGVFDGHQCLVMEAIDGHDLGQVLRRSKSKRAFLPVDCACFLARTLLDALAAVHGATTRAGARLDLVHCDVSPHNLFVSRAGQIKLGDFGLAKRANDQVDDALAQGRPAYLSPELLDGEVSVLSDLWAAAVTAYELLTLECPFTGDSLEALGAAIRKGKEKGVREHRPELPAAIEVVLRKALEKDPALRYQSAADFAAALTPNFDAALGNSAAVAAMVRGLFPERGRKLG